jgi:cell division protein FtsL
MNELHALNLSAVLQTTLPEDFWLMAVQALMGLLVVLVGFQARQLAATIKELQLNNQKMQIEIARMLLRVEHLERDK